MPPVTPPEADANQRAARHIAETLRLLSDELAPQRRELDYVRHDLLSCAAGANAPTQHGPG